MAVLDLTTRDDSHVYLGGTADGTGARLRVSGFGGTDWHGDVSALLTADDLIRLVQVSMSLLRDMMAERDAVDEEHASVAAINAALAAGEAAHDEELRDAKPQMVVGAELVPVGTRHAPRPRTGV